jgi:phage terminase small subunit
MKGGHPRSGPPQLTAEERQLRGSRTRRHHRDRLAPNVVAAFPAPTVHSGADEPLEPPSHLEKAGRDEWYRLADLLRAEGRLSASDQPALMVASAAVDLAAQIRRRKRRAHGDAFLRFVAAERNAMTEYRKAMSDMCLTAATRGRAPKAKPRPIGNDQERQKRHERFFGGAYAR